MARLARLICIICAASAAQVANAAAPVVESQPTPSTSTRPPTTYAPPASPSTSSGVRAYGAEQGEVVVSDTRSAPPSSTVSSSPVGSSAGSGAASMFQQFQQLQDDISELRGIVEEQSHLIAKLQADQKEQYLDLDRRIAALTGSPGPTGTSNGSGTSTGPTTSMGGGGPMTTGPANAGNSERDAYTTAFNMTKDKRFTDAIAAFNQMLVTYPKGEYSGNAYYWLGELYLALPEPALEKSRQSFAQVVNQYPANPKISDAMYKLGVVYHRIGDRTKALEYLNRVQSQFPGTQAAKLAQSYAAELR